MKKYVSICGNPDNYLIEITLANNHKEAIQLSVQYLEDMRFHFTQGEMIFSKTVPISEKEFDTWVETGKFDKSTTTRLKTFFGCPPATSDMNVSIN